MPTIGDKWKEAREAAGLSAIQAADLAGLHRNTIYDLENDKDGVTLRVMKQVAAVYGVALAEIFAVNGERETVPSELRPLTDALSPLSHEARLAVVRNIASNLRFMAQVQQETKITTPLAGDTYNSRSSAEYYDEPAPPVAAVAIKSHERADELQRNESEEGREKGRGRGGREAHTKRGKR